MGVSAVDAMAAAVLAVLAVTDFRRHRLPWRWMAALVALALLSAVLKGGWMGLVIALVSGLVAALPFWTLRRLLPRDDARWRLGGGDLRLAFALGAWLGALPALLLLAVASGLAGVAGFALKRAQPLGTWCVAVLAGGWLMTRL